MSLSKDLENLKYVKDIFSQLAAGRHIDASADAEWWSALQGEHKDDYAILFKYLGKKLEIDPRGFAYFNFDEDANQKAVDIDEDREIKRLFYNYQNEPKPEFRDRSQIHYGTVRLNISEDNNKLDGEYWTSRKSVGTISLKRKLK